MRLTPDQTSFIKHAIAEHFGSGARVWLFGSRVDDARRGGDVDLYVEPEANDSLFDRRVHCLAELVGGLPYPVDLVVAESNASRPIDRVALKSGVRL